MRVIETEMMNAVLKNREWSKDNTLVRPYTDERNGEVRLFGNLIATFDWHSVYVVEQTFKRFPTRTTASRLNALGLSVNYGSRNCAIHRHSVVIGDQRL